MNKKLDKFEILELSAISENFINIHERINEIETSINKLKTEGLALIESLNSIRNTEFEYTEKLKDKYGDGKIDLHTLTWEIK